MLRSQNTFDACLYETSDHFDINRQDLKCSSIQLVNMSFAFIITSIVRILLTLKVILNFVEYKEDKTLLMLVCIKNLINLMSKDMI